jgi:hypothetical protein
VTAKYSSATVRFGDPGVGHGHLESLVAEEGGDGFETHSPVDGLGGEGVTELVGVDVADSGLFGDGADHAGGSMPVDAAGPVGEEDAMSGDVFPVGLSVGGDVSDQVGVEGMYRSFRSLPTGTLSQ